MKKVLISEPISEEGLALLAGKCEVVMAGGQTEEAVLKDISDISAVVLKSKTKITRRVIEAASELRIISRTGAGYDNVDVKAATEHNIMVCNLPGINAVSVAEQTMAFLLALAKRVPEMDGYVRNGMWNKRGGNLTMELHGKTLGIVGLGQIGYRVMKMAQAFGMRTLAYDPYVRERYAGETEFSASLEELFAASDFITLHVPNFDETRHMIREHLLLRMKRNAYLINTSRGEVLDEQALISLLQQGRIGGAALDVFQREPLEADHPFIGMKNVILSPHSAALTKECGAKMTVEAVRQVVDWLEGRIPPHVVNRKEIRI